MKQFRFDYGPTNPPKYWQNDDIPKLEPYNAFLYFAPPRPGESRATKQEGKERKAKGLIFGKKLGPL